MPEEKGKSLIGCLVDMPMTEFQAMIAAANMTVLLNVMQALNGAYSHTFMVKNALIDAIETNPRDSWAATDAVASLHTVLMNIEVRFLAVKEAVRQRDSDTENAYRNLLKRGF